LALERRVEDHDLADVVGLDDVAVAGAQPLVGRLDVPLRLDAVTLNSAYSI
jgi:hypothetical protein